MALTNKITPSNLNPAYNQIISVLDSTNDTESKFRYIFQISGCTDNELLATVKIADNPDGFGVFDAHRILENKVSANIQPQLSAITDDNTSFYDYKIEYGEEYVYYWPYDDFYFYSNTASTYNAYIGLTGSSEQHYFTTGDTVLVTQDPTFTGTPNFPDGTYEVVEVIDDYSFIINQVYDLTGSSSTISGTSVHSDLRVTQFTGLTATSCNYIWNGALSHQDFRTYDDTSRIIRTGTTAQFLSNVPNNWKFDLDSEAYLLAYKSGSTAFNNLVIKDSNGTTTRISNSATGDTLMVPVGPDNINDAVGSTLIDSTVTRYSAYTEDTTSARTSEVKVFDVYEKCSMYNQYQLIFMDRAGSFISFNFDLVSRKTFSIERENYKKIVGSYDSSANSWGYNSYDRGKTNLNTGEKQRVKVTSDWITESNAAFLRELFTSPEVYHIDSDGNWLAVNITNTTYEQKFRVNERLINYELEFEYSYIDPIQRG